MVTEAEINPKNHTMPRVHRGNFLYLYYVINEIRFLYARPMVITSGYRTMKEHIALYDRINARLKKEKNQWVPIPLRSPHLICAAVDISDPNGELYDWLSLDFEDYPPDSILADYDLYMEHRDNTPAHVHLQTVAPKSGKRIFYA